RWPLVAPPGTRARARPTPVLVQQDDGPPVRVAGELDALDAPVRDQRGAVARHTSTTSAAPVSPAAQPVNSPRPPPRCSSAWMSSTTPRTPVGPCGCP